MEGFHPMVSTTATTTTTTKTTTNNNNDKNHNHQHEHVQGVMGLLNTAFLERMGRGVCAPRFRAPQLLGRDFIPKDSLGFLKVRQNPAEQLVTNWVKLSFSQPECTVKLSLPLVNWRYEIKVKGLVSLVISPGSEIRAAEGFVATTV